MHTLPLFPYPSPLYITTGIYIIAISYYPVSQPPIYIYHSLPLHHIITPITGLPFSTSYNHSNHSSPSLYIAQSPPSLSQSLHRTITHIIPIPASTSHNHPTPLPASTSHNHPYTPSRSPELHIIPLLPLPDCLAYSTLFSNLSSLQSSSIQSLLIYTSPLYIHVPFTYV